MAKDFKVPVTSTTTQKNIRFPDDIIEGVEKAIRGTGSNFSTFVIAATKWALENLKEQEEKNQEQSGE